MTDTIELKSVVYFLVLMAATALFSCSGDPEYEQVKTESSEAVRTTDEDAENQNNSESRENEEADENIPGTPSTNSNEDSQDDPVQKPVSQLIFSWDAPADSDIISYMVRAKNTETGTTVSLVSKEGSSVNLNQPEISVSVESNSILASLIGSMVCFTLYAVNSSGESDPSEESCTQL